MAADSSRCRTPDVRVSRKALLAQRSPVLEVRSRCFTFGESSEEEGDADSGRASSSSPISVPFGRSRRMSRSLPELRDLPFVAVLPDLAEEDFPSSSEEEQEQEVAEGEGGRRAAAAAPWHRKLEYLWSSACQALGLANVWRFPYYCYSNGGGSFVLPYVVFVMVCGVPFLCMELAVGQITQSGPISALGQLCPLMKGIGVASMMLSFWMTAYYSVLTAWTLFYAFNSFYSPPRWTRCTNTWNTEACQHISLDPNFTIPNGPNVSYPAHEFFHIKLLDESSGIEESGELRFELLASVLFVWILTYFCLRKADFLRGSSLCVFTVLSHLLLLSLFLRTVSLPGAKDGLVALFRPEWETMFEPRVLLCALAQAFHSLSVVLGPSILMGSYHKQHNNLLRDTMVVAAVSLFTVLMVGCVAFSTIGHLADRVKRPFWTVLSDDPGDVFVIYSVVIGSMPLPSCWGVLFFLMFLFSGLDSEIKLMATLISALKEAYTYYIKQRFQGHSLFLAVICGFCFFASIPYLTQAGIYFFQLIDFYIAVLGTIIVALFEICTVSWVYGARNLIICIQQMTGKTTSNLYQFCWLILTPITILATLIYSLIDTSGIVIKKEYAYPQWAIVLGWILFALTLCWIPFLAVAAYRKAPKSHAFSRLASTIQPRLRSEDGSWDPKPVIILNGSTVTDFTDSRQDAVQSYVDKHALVRMSSETAF